MAAQYHCNSDAVVAATPLAAPSHDCGSAAQARLPRLPSVNGHLCHTEPHLRSDHKASSEAVCACRLRERSIVRSSFSGAPCGFEAAPFASAAYRSVPRAQALKDAPPVSHMITHAVSQSGSCKADSTCHRRQMLSVRAAGKHIAISSNAVQGV